MVDASNTWNVTNGMDVVGVDDEKVGDVAEVHPDYIVVSKGFFLPTDYYIPISAVTSVTDKVYLNVTKDEALNQGWDTMPEYGTTTDAVYDDRPVTDAGYDTDAEPFEHRSSAEHVDDADRINVPLTEEELTAHKRAVDRGKVQVEKVVTEEQQSIDVPITEERVTVNRRAVDRDVAPGDTAFTEGTIEVPVHGEEVVVDKQAHVREEVEIGKEQVQRTERVMDTVRREDARIRDEDGTVVEEVDSRNSRR